MIGASEIPSLVAVVLFITGVYVFHPTSIQEMCVVVYRLLRSSVTTLSYTHSNMYKDRQAFFVTPKVYHLFISCSMTQQCLRKYLILENKLGQTLGTQYKVNK